MMQDLEAQQKDAGKADTSILDRSKSDALGPCPTQLLPDTSDQHEVQEDRQKSYLVGSSMQKTVDLATATIQHGSHSRVRSTSQSNTPMAFVPPYTTVRPDARSKVDKDAALSPLTSSSTVDTSPAPGPASVPASLRASANGSPHEGHESGGATPQHPMGARACSDETVLSEQRYGTDLYKERSSSGSIIFAGPSSNAGSQAGPDTITQDDMIVKADIGFSNKNGRVPGAQTSFWSAMTDNINLRAVPLLSLGQLTKAQATNDQAQQAERKERERSNSRERELMRAYARGQSSNPSSRETTPPRTPGKATPASLSAPGTPTMKGYTPVGAGTSTGAGLSARGTPHGHINTALPSPHGSAASSARGRRQGSSLVASGPLSARGINPERHPALHEKELAEMTRLVEMHCQVSCSRDAFSGVWGVDCDGENSSRAGTGQMVDTPETCLSTIK